MEVSADTVRWIVFGTTMLVGAASAALTVQSRRHANTMSQVAEVKAKLDAETARLREELAAEAQRMSEAQKALGVSIQPGQLGPRAFADVVRDAQLAVSGLGPDIEVMTPKEVPRYKRPAPTKRQAKAQGGVVYVRTQYGRAAATAKKKAKVAASMLTDVTQAAGLGTIKSE